VRFSCPFRAHRGSEENRSKNFDFMSHRTLVSAVALLALLVPRVAAADRSELVPEIGYDYGEVETGRALAMGDAMRALGNGVTGLYANPANIALTRVYHLEALAQIGPEARRQTYGASAVDSVTNRLAGAVGGNYGVLDPDGVDRRWTDVRLALAFPVSDRLYVGITGKYLKLHENGFARPGFGLPAPSAASAGLGTDAIVDGITFDAGITVKPTESLFIGLVGTNLTNPGTGFQPTTFGGGIGFGTNDITVEGDVVADFTTYTSIDGSTRTNMRAMFGFEFLAGDHYPLRLGYRYDRIPATHALSAGLGYIDPQFAVDVSVRRSVAGKDPYGPFTAIVVDLQYFIESTGMTKSPVEGD
jgi:hypothetical protein